MSGRFKFKDGALQSRAQSGQGFNILGMYNGGLVPNEFLGLGYNSGGSSLFSNVAHNVEQAKRLENIANNGVSDEVQLAVKLKDKNVVQPFQMNGKVYRPDKNGVVRITDKGKIDTAMKIKKYQEKIVDDLMDYALLGDDVCMYMFGLTSTEWFNLCAKRDSENNEMNLSKDLNNVDCSIRYIESLPPSLQQTQSISKLRAIVKHHASSVNLEGITTHDDTSRNIRDGHNNPSRLDDTNPLGGSIARDAKEIAKASTV